jgi:tetratricopeptide (TPR) repeat protein
MSFNNRGNALMAKGDAKAALNDYMRAIQILPKSFEALTGSGSAKFQLGDLRGAVTDYSAALKIFPKNTLILMNRAGALETIDQDASILDYTLVIELEPENALAYARRGITNLEKGRKPEAAADLKKAFAIDPALKTEFSSFLQRAMK